MARPTLLVAEREPGSALSTRKLVLETGKFNVLTAHSAKEASEIFSSARTLVSALILTSEINNGGGLAAQLRKERKDLPIIFLAPNRTTLMKDANHSLSSHDPQALLELCRELFGDPRAIDGQ